MPTEIGVEQLFFFSPICPGLVFFICKPWRLPDWPGANFQDPHGTRSLDELGGLITGKHLGLQIKINTTPTQKAPFEQYLVCTNMGHADKAYARQTNFLGALISWCLVFSPLYFIIVYFFFLLI